MGIGRCSLCIRIKLTVMTHCFSHISGWSSHDMCGTLRVGELKRKIMTAAAYRFTLFHAVSRCFTLISVNSCCDGFTQCSRCFTVVHCLKQRKNDEFWSGRGGSVNQREPAWTERERPYMIVNDHKWPWTTLTKNRLFFVRSIFENFVNFGVNVLMWALAAHLGTWALASLEMAKTVADAMQRAADRAARRVELENAKLLMERTLGYDIPDVQLDWVSVLSHVWKA